MSLLFVFSGCSDETPQEVIRPVRVMKLGDLGSVSGRPFPGRAEAAEEVNLSFRVSGPLVAMAKGDFERATQLVKQQVLSQEDYDRRRQTLIRTQANLRSAEQALKIGE